MHSLGRRIAAVLVATAALGGAILGASAAVAAPQTPSIRWADARLETVFGGSVASSLRMDGLGDLCEERLACRIDLSARAGSFAPPEPGGLSTDPAGETVASWSIKGGTAALPVGTHRVDAALTLPDGAVLRAVEPLEIEVDAGTLGTALSIVADPGDPGGAIVAAQLGGDYLGSVNSSRVGQPLRTPAGSWAVVVTDASGAEVFEASRTVVAGGPIATSWYWSGVPADGAFTASATFALSGEAAGNVSVQQPATAAFASPSAAAAPVVEVTPTLQPEPTVGDSVPIPTGSVAIAGVVAFALLVAAIVLAVRLERRVARADASVAGGQAVPRA